MVQPETAFRAERLIVAAAVAPLFVIEDIRIGAASQFVGGQAIPSELFSPEAHGVAVSLDVAAGGTEIRFRVRCVGDDPRGARFTAALIGTAVDGGGRRRVLPIDSGCAIVG